MARTNVDDEWYADPLERRAALIQAMTGLPVNAQWMADGAAMKAWRLAQKYWKDGGKLIPEDVWQRAGLEPMIACDLAERHPEGIYVKGTEDRTDWLRQRVDAGKAGGKKRASGPRDKHGRFHTTLDKTPHDAGETSSDVHTPATPLALALDITSPLALGDGPPTAPAKKAKTPKLCKTWDDQDPLAKPLANLCNAPGYGAVFDAPKDKAHLEALMLRYVIPLHEMVHLTADLAIWAIDPPRVVKSWRSTLTTFCRLHVERRDAKPQAKGVTPLDRRVFDY